MNRNLLVPAFDQRVAARDVRRGQRDIGFFVPPDDQLRFVQGEFPGRSPALDLLQKGRPGGTANPNQRDAGFEGGFGQRDFGPVRCSGIAQMKATLFAAGAKSNAFDRELADKSLRLRLMESPFSLFSACIGTMNLRIRSGAAVPAACAGVSPAMGSGRDAPAAGGTPAPLPCRSMERSALDRFQLEAEPCSNSVNGGSQAREMDRVLVFLGQNPHPGADGFGQSVEK